MGLTYHGKNDLQDGVAKRQEQKMKAMQATLEKFSSAASDSLRYARQWKDRTGKAVVGSFPMHFPVELAHAAGALPVIIQEAEDPITDGEGAVFSFYCGYNRSVVDQALKGELNFLDGIMFGDHCVQLLGTADIVRWHNPEMPILFNQLVSSMDASWAFDEARAAFAQLRIELEDLLDVQISDDALRASIALFNRNRQLIRRLYELREQGKTALSARELQHIIKSSMVMDRAEHTRMLEGLVTEIEATPASPRKGMQIYLSGHLCQAPKLELLDMIENTGAVVVGDDLYHGYRYISTDVAETGDPLDALAHWYFERNDKVPCPTRADGDADWDEFLVREVRRTGAEGLIVLVAKFCEPHMYYFPEINEACDHAGIPILRLETEHDSMPLEAFKTRVETFVEVARRRHSQTA